MNNFCCENLSPYLHRVCIDFEIRTGFLGDIHLRVISTKNWKWSTENTMIELIKLFSPPLITDKVFFHQNAIAAFKITS